MKTKSCECWTCKSLSPKVKSFRETLTTEQLEKFNELFDELWNAYESDSMDLDVLRSKIEGSWPNNGQSYYERIGEQLFEVIGKLIEPKCDHEFKSDGGECIHCHKTVVKLNNL